jgi:threonine-phosphate decarboxylase
MSEDLKPRAPRSQSAATQEPLALDRVHGGNPQEQILDFSASINPLGPPPGALEAYQSAAFSMATYPSPYPHQLEARIARWLGVEAASVLAGNGTTHLIYLIARVLKPHRPFVVIPTFSEIANALIASGSSPMPAATRPDSDFRLDRETVMGALGRKADALFIGRPNSPTGAMPAFAQASEIARECARAGAWCVFDEAFIDFVDGARSTAALALARANVVVLRSLTKIFAIPGLRLGCLVARPDVAARFRETIEPWSVNSAAEQVGLRCLEDTGEFITRTQESVAGERAYVAEALARVGGIRVFPSVANFLMFKVENEPAAGSFGRFMEERRVRVRDLRVLAGCGPGFYRIGLRLRADNTRLIVAARAWRP